MSSFNIGRPGKIGFAGKLIERVRAGDVVTVTYDDYLPEVQSGRVTHVALLDNGEYETVLDFDDGYEYTINVRPSAKLSAASVH